MIALQIADIKTFMKKLLLSESFDRFLLLEGSITTFNTFHIDGTLQKAYFTWKTVPCLTGVNCAPFALG